MTPLEQLGYRIGRWAHGALGWFNALPPYWRAVIGVCALLAVLLAPEFWQSVKRWYGWRGVRRGRG